jgi:hypothetical protein
MAWLDPLGGKARRAGGGLPILPEPGGPGRRHRAGDPAAWRLGLALLGAATLPVGQPAAVARADGGTGLVAAADRPGTPAPAPVERALSAALAQATAAFEAKDLAGVLAHVSDQYRTGPFTKPTVRAQLLALFQLYDTVRVRVRIDEVRMVGEHAWVYSSGEINGRLPVLGSWMAIHWWERELEVARLEGGVWRLYGYQR